MLRTIHFWGAAAIRGPMPWPTPTCSWRSPPMGAMWVFGVRTMSPIVKKGPWIFSVPVDSLHNTSHFPVWKTKKGGYVRLQIPILVVHLQNHLSRNAEDEKNSTMLGDRKSTRLNSS